MIRQAIPFGTAGEAIRIDTAGYARASIRITADDSGSGAIEIRRGYTNNHTAAYPSPQTADITGATPIDLIVDDCPELVVVVTTAGSGSFDVEWELDNQAPYAIQEFYASLGAIGEIQSLLNRSDTFDRVTVFAARDGANTNAVVDLRASLDTDGIATTLGTINLDGNPTTFDIEPRSRLDLYTSAGNAGLGCDFVVYLTQSATKLGVKTPDNVALLDASQVFSELQIFSNRIMLGDLSTGVTTMDTNSTFNQLVDLPDASGELAVVLSSESPSDDDHVIRSGAGYKSVPQAGTAFPASPYDGQSYYRTDLDVPEVFHWDATRGKWLGELRVYQLSRNSSSNISLSLRHAGAVIQSSSKGYLIPSPLTIVGVEIYTAAKTTADLDLFEGSTFVATLYTLSASRSGHDHTLNQDIDGDTGWPQKWFQFRNITTGSVNNPVVNILARRHES